ncbi:MAG TPA: DUF2341 domain-containing protein [Candidatus Saccharimonadales bacterium]
MILPRRLDKAKLTMGLLAVAAIVILAIVIPRAMAVDPTWLAGWSNRSPIVVNNTANSSALTNYQVKVTLPSAGFDYSKLKTGAADLRFTDSDGTTQLKFWIEKYDATAKTGTIWVKVPTVAANANRTIFAYYGNASATSQSDGKATFPFFSNFDNPAWKELPSLPVAAQNADETVALVNNKFYIIGGYNQGAGDPLGINYSFDPATNAYAKKADMPTLRWGPISAAVNGKIYVFGGRNNSGGSTANEMYDPVANTWTTKAALPAGLADQGITGCTDGTLIYLAYNNLLYVYNPATNTYTQKASMSNSTMPMLSWSTCSYVNGKVYIINGYANGVATDTTRIYDVATNTWSAGAPSPFATYGSMRENVVIGNKIYLVQGQRASAEFSSAVYEYDIPTNTWTEKSFGKHAADGVAGGVHNGKIYTFAGRQDWTGPYGLLFASVYNPAADTDTNWLQKSGNYQADATGLTRMVPVLGTIANGPVMSQVQSNYQTSGNFVLEAQGTQSGAASWNTITIHANQGTYGQSLNGYHVPYNDFGVTPQATSIYKETGATFTKLGTDAAIANGSQRFKVVSTASNIALYRNDTLINQTNDTTYHSQGGIHIATGNPNTSAWNFVFTRAYTATEPTVSVGYEQTDPADYNTCPCTVLGGSGAPASTSSANTSAYELGTRFYSETAGNVTALKFYKVAGMASSHVGNLWSNTGAKLATVTFSGETASGWQTATLSSPVAINANTPYVVSYVIATGPFAFTQSQFATTAVDAAPLHAFQNGIPGVGVNGVFKTGGTGFPTESWNATNYWADVVMTN